MKYLFSVLIVLKISISVFSQDPNFLVTDLRCEYLQNPQALDVDKPRFTWKITDIKNGAVQSACQIIVGTDSMAVVSGNGNMWKSGKFNSNSTLVAYQGKPLKPYTNYFWKVMVWNQDKKQNLEPNLSSFRTGIKQQNNWVGNWITDSRDVTLKPAAYFRKEFKKTKEVKSAFAYIAAAGLYELKINGNRIGNHVLDPAYTRFDRRNLYVAHDVTSLIQKENTIGVLLGNGWYNHQSTAVWYFHEAPWRARPGFCLDLRIEYTDGTTEFVSTDKSWKTHHSPITFNSIYTGEHFNANLEENGWGIFGFKDDKWENSLIMPAPSQNIVSQQMHPIRATEEIPAKTIRKTESGKYIFDIGKNIAGVSKLSIKGDSGTVVRVTHSELLDKNGNLDMSNINLHYRPTDDTDPFQTDIYTLSGKGLETFSPRFNYKGFQYVEVSSNKPIELTKESLTGVELHSDLPKIGYINSSNNTLNKIWEATNSSYLANLFGYPTDCPQREKNGWTGDAHIAIETALYNFDGITIYEKWLKDHQDEQQPNGVLPAIIPTSGWGYHWANGPDWTSTIAIIPWNIYQFYGDSRLLAECYPNIKNYVDAITKTSEGNLTSWGLGDWIPVTTKPPVEYTSSIYYYTDVTILAKTAKILGNESDFAQYSKLASNIKTAFNEKYFNKIKGSYGNGSQTELSAALHWGLVPEDAKQLVAKNLAQKVIDDGKHLNVGLLGSKTILNALSENGYADLAYEVASQETYPSWGWWIKNGLTTLPENWNLENEKNDISHNHIMFGEISAWYYKALGGIKPDPNIPGFRNILLEPHFVEGLNAFEAVFNAPTGKIESSWKKENGKIMYQVIVPPNATASLRLQLKTGQKITQNQKNLPLSKDYSYQLPLVSGKYVFEIK